MENDSNTNQKIEKVIREKKQIEQRIPSESTPKPDSSTTETIKGRPLGEKPPKPNDD